MCGNRHRGHSLRGMHAIGAAVVLTLGLDAFPAFAQTGTQPQTTRTAVPATSQPSSSVSQAADAVPVKAGGVLHGTVKSGNVPLPGVAITATNTLTGRRFATTTDITGAWSMTIPQNGRYVVRTEFAAFASVTEEALLNATSHDHVLNFDLMLASRAAQQEARADQQAQTQQMTQAIRQIAGNGAESLSLINSLAAGTDVAEGGTTASGAALPSAAESASAGSDSVAINGQSGQVSPLAGLDPERMRDAIETMRAQGGGGFFGGPGLGGPGGFGGGQGGFGGRGNFRGFRPDQPHGAVFWTGSNSALNAEPFSLRGQESNQPDYGSNRFGLTFIGEPFIPKLIKPSGKDTVFLTLSGTRSSSPVNEYAVVPTAAQRGSCVNSVASSHSAGCNLLSFFPMPNLTDNGSYNYYFASTQQSNSTQAGFRYIRAIGRNASLPTGGGRGGGGRRQSQSQGLRQSINLNYNWSDSASDNINLFPNLGGKTSSHSYSVQTGYSLGYRRMNNNLTGGWNRSVSQVTNLFTNGTDIATEIGVLGPDGAPLNSSSLNYGVPNIVLSGTTGLSEQQPSFGLQQTITVSDVFSYREGKHNYRFGADFRRVHHDVLGSSNATGTFNFTGDTPDDAIAALLNDQPTSSTIQSSIFKDYLRENTWDVYALDDFRALSYLTLNYGIRYEYFSPVSEKYNHLSGIAANPDFTQIAEVYPGCTGLYCGSLPNTLVYPFRTGFAPRLGLALRLPKSSVVRVNYGINFTNSQFASFATSMAHQPPFANVQTNTTIPITLENGFPVPETEQAPNYAVAPHYTLPYLQVWSIDVQKTLPWGIVINAGYNGSKGTHLDDKIAPYPSTQTSSFAQNPLPFQYEFSSAFSNFNNASLRVRKRLERGVSLGAYYQYSHSIDDAGALGGASTVVAQNWQDIAEDEGNSSIDQRHRLTGDYLFELPFGKDKTFLTGGGFASRALEGISISGAFTFATGTPLNPTFLATGSELLTNTAGSERPNRTPGVSLTAGGGSQLRWFNTAAFSTTPPPNGIGNAARNSIPGPGIVTNNMSLSKTEQFGDTRSLEVRATAGNVFNTVQFSGVDTNVQSPTFGQVNLATTMRTFQFLARFRF